MTRIKCFTALSCLLLLSAVLGSTAKGQNQTNVLNMIPEDTVLCVVINDVSGTIDKAATYFNGVLPWPFKDQATAQLKSVLGQPESLPEQIVIFYTPLQDTPPKKNPFLILASNDGPGSPQWNKPDNNGIFKIADQNDAAKTISIAKKNR